MVKHRNYKIRKKVKFVLFIIFSLFYMLDTEVVNKIRVGIFTDPYAYKSLIDTRFLFEGRLRMDC